MVLVVLVGLQGGRTIELHDEAVSKSLFEFLELKASSGDNPEHARDARLESFDFAERGRDLVLINLPPKPDEYDVSDHRLNSGTCDLAGNTMRSVG